MHEQEAAGDASTDGAPSPRSAPAAKPTPPQATARRGVWKWFVAALAIVGLGSRVGRAFYALLFTVVFASAFAWRGFHHIKTDPGFCMGCHLMESPGDKWRGSAHKEVICQQCHRADIFEEARLGFAAYIERKTEIGPHAKVPSAICNECHLSADAKIQQIGATAGHKSHAMVRDLACVTCHATKVHQFAATEDSCLQCHGKDQLKLGKAPDHTCFGCHDFMRPAELGLPPKAQDCRACHEPEKVAVAKGHEDCLGCHRPHGKPLADPTDCIACHKQVLVADNAHVKDERLESCLECHAPHEK